MDAPLDGAGLALEPVRDEHAVLLGSGGGHDVGALEGLLEEAEDVEDDEDALLGVGGAGGVCGGGLSESGEGTWASSSSRLGRARTGLEAAEVFVAALGLVALGHDGRNVAAGGAVAGGGGHGGHPGGSTGQIAVLGVFLVLLAMDWLL